jgi:hypothetical protein
MIVSILIPAAEAAESTSADASLLAPAIVAAVVAGVVALMTFVLAGRRARLDRQRQVFRHAFEAVMEYREYPYIVRRRSPDEPAEERRRITGDLSRVHARLSAFEARLLVENPYIGQCYAELVQRTRQVAGAMIKAAWDNDPVAADREMHAPPYDFMDLDQYDERYLRAVANHLGWMPRWARRSDDTVRAKPANS